MRTFVNAVKGYALIVWYQLKANEDDNGEIPQTCKVPH